MDYSSEEETPPYRRKVPEMVLPPADPDLMPSEDRVHFNADKYLDDFRVNNENVRKNPADPGLFSNH